MEMKSFFRYFGAKYSMAKHYGPPKHECVIEPFAGGAGYSCYWEPKKVILVEKNKEIVDLWQWLINASYEDIMDLPMVYSVDEFDDDIPIEARHLIQTWWGWGDFHWRDHISVQNKKKLENGNVSGFWCCNVRNRIANNIHKIKHWEIIHGDYTDAPDIDAHWHIDPPYQHQGKVYKCGPDVIDFSHLGEWCLSRKGYGEVCEAEPADWLDFDVFKKCVSQNNEKYNELIYRINNEPNGNLFEGGV